MPVRQLTEAEVSKALGGGKTVGIVCIGNHSASKSTQPSTIRLTPAAAQQRLDKMGPPTAPPKGSRTERKEWALYDDEQQERSRLRKLAAGQPE